MSAQDPNERFISLEMKVAYQEKLISELNEVLLERGNEIDQLVRRVLSLERMVREGTDGREFPHERPPHY